MGLVGTATRSAAGSAAKRLPMLKHVPLLRLIAIAEIALLARRHLQHLDPDERRRLAFLIRRGRRLSPPERAELRALVAKLEPRAFAGGAANRVSPVPLPRRLTKQRY